MRESYKIDTVSNLYPAVGGHIFRLCAVFKRAIDKDCLAKALKSIQTDFPIIFSHLEKTFYSYIHISAADLDIIEDGDPFMRPPQMFNTEKPSLRMYVKGELLSMDIFHGNADGRAAFQFFNALLRNYALLLDSEPLPKPVPAKREDLLDPYPVCYERVRPASFFGKESYRIRLPIPETPYMRFSCVSVDLNALKGVTARLGITVNDFFCAALYQAIADETDARRSGLPVSLSISIDLRPAFGSNTQRNFSYYTNVCISPGDAPDFEGCREAYTRRGEKGSSP